MPEKPTYEELEQRIRELESSAADLKDNTTFSKESEQMYKHCFENANIGVCLTDPDGNFLLVNNRMVEIFGYSKKDFEGMNVDDVSHPEDIIISKEVQRRTKAGESEHNVFQKRYIHKKGHLFWGKVSNSIVRDNDEKPLYFVTHFTDITDNKKALEELQEHQKELESFVNERTKELSLTNEALKEKERDLQNLLKAIQAGVVVHNVKKERIVQFNPAAKKLLGLKEDQILNRSTAKPMWEFVHEDGNPMQVDEYPVNIVKKTKRPLLDYLVGIRKPNENLTTWALVSATPQFDKEGKLSKVIVSSMDVSELKKIQSELSEKTEQLMQAKEELTQKAHDLGERVKELNCLYAISNLVENPNTSLESFIQSAIDLIPPSFQYPEICCSRIILQDREWRTSDFKETQWKLSIDIITSRKKIGFLEVYYFEERPVIDIGPFLKEEKNLLSEIAERLGQTIGRIRTNEEREVLRKQLQKAQKMESIGNLAGGIAHDFNNILSSVIGFTELALDDVEKNSMVEDNLQEVYTASKRAKGLVSQILAFARQSEEEMKPIQVDVIVKEVLQFIRSSIPTDIEIKKNINSDSLIMGNQTQVHQIMMNLCTNAAHAMEADGGTLEVTLKDIDVDKGVSKKIDLTPGNYIKLSVSDTGTGIPPDNIDAIFEPYFTTKDPGEGTGMGLAMVQGIIESYGGKIAVESVLTEGTTFTVYIPVTRKRKTQRQYEPEELPKGTERILFVDDEAPIAKMGSQGLERLGYQVTTRTSSVEALELFSSKPDDFDLVVTDMTMPNLTGDKLTVELMKIRRDIPIILCTGYSKRISDETASEIGIKAFAYKPVVKADLAKTVRKVLDEAKS